MAVERDRSRAYRAGRAEFRAECAAGDVPCWLCGQAIAYAEPDGTTDDSFSNDHFFPVSTPFGAKVQNDPAGWRASHTGCNRRRGNRDPDPALGATSRRWL
jgi:hypothetical protein